MMKKLLSLTVLVSAMFTASDAVAAVDAHLRARNYATTRTSASRSESVPPFIPVIVKGSDDGASDYLESIGSVIFGQRDNIIICCVPSDCIDLLDTDSSIVTATSAASLTTTLDVALDAACINPVHNGYGLPSPFDGSGVVAGLCDIGFDPSHETFDNRVALMTVYDTKNAVRHESYRPTRSIAGNASASYHATHVASIMAGGTHTSTPYHGAAPGAEIVATMSDLTDVGILAGIDDIIAYAQSVGKPAVVNISLGSYIGPHDGTSLFNQYLDRQAQEAIICISAGNNGNQPYTLSHRFESDHDKLRTTISTWDCLNPSGIVDIWSSDNRDMQLALGIWDSDINEWIAFTPYTTGNLTIDTRNADCNRKLPRFNELFDGYITVESEVNSENNRFHTAVWFDYRTEIKSSAGEWGRYRIAMMIRASEGARVDMFTDGNETMLRAIKAPGFENGNSLMSISDLACSRGAIAVGMINDRSTYPLADGTSFADTFSDGTVSPNSSYATLPDGTVLPHVTAPGNHVVAALNKVYHGLYPGAMPVVAESRSANGEKHLWTAAGGTSMASPLVAGTIATWLEARPDLTVTEAREALIATARTDMSDSGDRRYGASGQLDAHRGLLRILDHSGVHNPLQTGPGIYLSHGTLIASAGITSMKLYDTTGRLVASSESPSLSVSHLAHGIYIAEISSGNSSEKISVRLH